jgi:NAD(P)-dependent dehydrogenase (short-subunit alcohol dehydrogenase family)
MSRLQSKVAVITGGTSGIGLAAAQRFVAEGAFVYIFARRQDELDKTVASIGLNIAGVPATSASSRTSTASTPRSLPMAASSTWWSPVPLQRP